MRRSIGAAINRLGWTNPLIFALLLAGTWSTVSGIASLVPGLEFRRFAPLVTVSLIAGWLLASTRIGAAAWALAGTILGASAVLIEVSSLGSLAGRGMVAFVRFSFDVKRWPMEGPPDPTPLYELVHELGASVSAVGGRLGAWLSGFPSNMGAYDLVVAALLWGFLLWIVSFWAAGAMRRWQRPVVSMAPAGTLLGVSLAYRMAEPVYLLPFLGVTLLLSVGQKLVNLDRRWFTDRVDYPDDIWIDMSAVGVGLVGLLVSLAVATPSISPRQLEELFRRLTPRQEAPAQTLAEALGLEGREVSAGGFGGLSYGGLPRRHLIGSGPELRDVVVMTIRETDVPPGSPLEGDHLPLPVLYWRSLTYDEYNGRGWETGETDLVTYPSGHLFLSETPPTYRLIEQDVQVLQNLNGLLHLAGTPVTVDAEIEVAWRGQPPESGPGGALNALEGDIFGIRLNSQAYQVLSLIPEPGSMALRDAGTDYPAGLRARYTQLPASIPDRVLALARDLTINKPTPYEQAIAIEAYLRTYPYTLDVPIPPATRDVADYFLFDLKEGYCDYYATAMVVLARAAGLPARIVMGFAAGRFDEESGFYMVTAADAHSWVEIFFPGAGWIEFEPTAGLPAITRPEGEGGSKGGAPTDALINIEDPPWIPPWIKARLSSGFFWLAAAIGGLALPLAGFYLRTGVQGYRLRHADPPTAMQRIFTDLYAEGHRLEVTIRPGTTVLEFSTGLRRRLAAFAFFQINIGRKHRFEQDLDAVVELFVQHLFSRREISHQQQSKAVHAWIRLHRLFQWVRVRQFLSSWLR